jgi:hypothetical protein
LNPRWLRIPAAETGTRDRSRGTRDRSNIADHKYVTYNFTDHNNISGQNKNSELRRKELILKDLPASDA